MKKVIDWRIEEAQQRHTIENKVNDLIKEGWQPRGELISEPESEHESGGFFQVMVRYESH